MSLTRRGVTFELHIGCVCVCVFFFYVWFGCRGRCCGLRWKAMQRWQKILEFICTYAFCNYKKKCDVMVLLKLKFKFKFKKKFSNFWRRDWNVSAVFRIKNVYLPCGQMHLFLTNLWTNARILYQICGQMHVFLSNLWTNARIFIKFVDFCPSSKTPNRKHS